MGKRAQSVMKRSIMKFMNGNEELLNPWGTLYNVRPVKRIVGMLESGMSPEDIRASLKQEFDVSDEKIDLSLAIAKEELAVLNDMAPRDAAIYLDIPFCPSKCTYCSFASLPADKLKQFAEPYLAALFRELEYVGPIVKDLGFTIRSVYIGGGTPTTLLAIELDNLLYKLHKTFDLTNLREFSVEAGRPDTITESKLSAMKKHGVNRVSVNPQTIHEKTLRRIGRRHSYEAILSAVQMVRAFDFPVLNMDVIAGLPGESLAEFTETLQAVAALVPENLTVHTMHLKRASKLRPEVFSPSLEEHRQTSAMLDFAYQFLAEKNYKAYYLYRQKNTLGNLENTGFCLPGTPCIYNIGMMEETMPVFGFGVGGVTKLVRNGKIERIYNVKDVQEYLNR
ncbi:MAG: coproporphyrinogen dehydrogenase HemZ, partial [Ruminococcaceae bacterium]|nr:coproporphyrinogen dehydrogenase HemZ [Oscillospiraceae bacterium]